MARPILTLVERLPEARSLSRADRRRLAHILGPLWLEPGEVLYGQGDPPDQMALLLSGTLVASAKMPDGSDLPLGRVRAGEIIGEMGLVDNAPRSATVTCEHSATLLTLDEPLYHQLERAADPLLAWMLNLAARSMARRIGAMTDRIANAAVDPSRIHALPKADQRPVRLWRWLLGLDRQA